MTYTHTTTVKTFSAPVVKNWGYLENWKSTASLQTSVLQESE